MEEKEKDIDELKPVLKNKDETIERLKAEEIAGGGGGDGGAGGREASKTAGQSGAAATGTNAASEDAFVKYYKNCLERQKEDTAEMEKRWKDEIMEKILVRDENTK